MKSSIRSDMRGIAHLAVILVVVVLVVVGAVGYRVIKGAKTKNSTNGTVANTVVANAETEKECKKFYNDDDLCKFVSRWNVGASYKASFVSNQGGTITLTNIEQDDKNNSYVVTKQGDTELAASIMLNGDLYLKNQGETEWTKYPKNPETENNKPPTEEIKFDVKEEESKPEEKRTVYKKIGKEKCGNATCFKYQVIDPEAPKLENFLWFGDKDYQLRKMSSKDAEGNTTSIEWEFINVNIKAPSPVKEAPAAPSQSDIQQYIDQSQQQSSDE